MSHISPLKSNAAFISYPKQAAFGRNLPKYKIYEHSGANTRLKDLFVEQVEQIVWQYKLAPETINLPAKPGDVTLNWQGQNYLLLEPTGPATLPAGQIASTSKTLVDSKQLSVQPVQEKG